MTYPCVNNVISPFEGNINTRKPQGITLYIQATREIEKEYDMLDISVSNTKDIIDNFPILENKYGWGRLIFMVNTTEGNKNIFC